LAEKTEIATMIREIHGISRIAGELTIPPSKSYTQRVLACSLISDKSTIIHRMGFSDDETAILELIKEAGADLFIDGETLRVKGEGFNPKTLLELNCNESGLGARMMTPILANSNHRIILNGKGTLLRRTMKIFDEVLPKMNVDFHSNDSRLPFNILGPLKPVSLEIDGSISSQFITGIILGYVASPLLREEILTVRNPMSIPYIELTIEILSLFGVDLKFEDNKIKFSGPYQMRNTEVTIEGDWSSGAFILVAAALGGDVTVKGLTINSSQADKRVLDALKDFGAGLIITDQFVRAFSNEKRPFTFDATHCPDLFPPLAVLASYAAGESRIKGLGRLTHKESNRALTIRSELKKMGADILFAGDEMIIRGVSEMKGTTIDSHGDHRIAMAASIMGLFASGSTYIQHSEAVNKSFPKFYDFLARLTQE
jgi:3-phosphoshikimate 1-carboxyvinyltransferase